MPYPVVHDPFWRHMQRFKLQGQDGTSTAYFARRPHEELTRFLVVCLGKTWMQMMSTWRLRFGISIIPSKWQWLPCRFPLNLRKGSKRTPRLWMDQTPAPVHEPFIPTFAVSLPLSPPLSLFLGACSFMSFMPYPMGVVVKQDYQFAVASPKKT